MARATKTTRASAKRATEPTPKKRLGRPLGSKNRVPTPARAKSAPASATKRGAVRKAAPAAPKMNKAELEAQVLKLERSIARLRKQNTELKAAAREEPAEAPKPVAAPKRAAATRTRRVAKEPAELPDEAAAAED